MVAGSPTEHSADFVVVRSDSVRTMGARPDQIAYAASAADVDQVVVAGSPSSAMGNTNWAHLPGCWKALLIS